ncbi:MAG TPA: glycosyltransferase family 2 protein [Acetobacteraceae bacterium]|nr:glycosyltransferase family 2 protein [Acetobacteraceae bacterium]
MPADTCLVTIVIPVFNSAATVTRAAASALCQDMASLELLIVDDGSNDDSLAEASRIADSDPRVRVIAVRHNRGKPHAMNRAIAQARGRWIAVLDADDCYANDRLATLIAAAEQNGADLVADNQFLHDAGAGQTVGTAFPIRRRDAALTRRKFIAGCDPFAAFNYGMLKPIIRTEFIRRTGLRYRENARLSEDFLYLVEFFAAGGQAWLVSQPLYCWTQAFGSVSRQWTNTGASAWRYDFLAARAANEDVRRAMRPAVHGDLIALLNRRETALRQLHWFRELCRSRDTGHGLRELLPMILRQPSMWPFVLRRALHAGWRRATVSRVAHVKVDTTVT